MNLCTTLTYVAVRCGECDINFGMPREFYDARQDDGRTWYCPNGHSCCFRESSEEKLKRELDRTTRCLQSTQGQLHITENSRRAYKGQLTKTRRRVSNGVCPCCNRTFADLANHMHDKHPEWAGES